MRARTKVTTITMTAALTAGGVLGFAVPASAAPTDDTTATFEVLAGTLDVTAPATADLGDGSSGDAIAGPMGAVTVVDDRGATDASWEATVTATDFTTGGATPAETVVASEIDYASGAATATTGDGTFTPGSADVLDNADPLPAFTHVGGTGGNSASWNPTVTVNAPLDSVAGVYTGTITHSVA